MAFVANIFWAGVVLGILIFVHEAGHFLAARFFGVGVEIFSLGFGKRLFGFRKGETDYRVSLVPLGGYVKLTAEEPSEAVSGSPKEFSSRKRWERAVILLAGPLTNLVVAFIFVEIALITGIPEPAYLRQEPLVGYVQPESPADRTGIKSGDVILKIAEKEIPAWNILIQTVALHPRQTLKIDWLSEGERRDGSITLGETEIYATGYSGIEPPIPFRVGEVIDGLAANKAGIRQGDIISAVDGHPIHHYLAGIGIISSHKPEESVLITVVREGTTMDIPAILSEKDGRGHLGVMIDANIPIAINRYAPHLALSKGVQWMRDMSALFFGALRRLITGELSMRAMSGPVDIAKFSGAAARTGAGAFLHLIAFISLNLAIVNLLPVPALDGGHLAILAVEGAVRRDIGIKVKETLAQVGFAVLLALMGVIVVLDIVKNL